MRTMLRLDSPSKMRVLRLLFVVLLLVLASSRVARADNFTPGELTAYSQVDWVSDPNAINLINVDFDSVYATSGGVLEIGIVPPGNFYMAFSDGGAILGYLPSSGPVGPLDKDLLNPTSSSAGIFGGDVLALALDVDFSAAGALAHPVGSPLGSLYLTGFDGTLAGLDGLTVSQFLGIDETLLGGGSNGSSISDLESVSQQIAGAFDPCTSCSVVGPDITYEDAHFTVTNPNGNGNPITTPEPSSLLLLASGLIALGMLGCWQRRQGIVLSDEAFEPRGN